MIYNPLRIFFPKKDKETPKEGLESSVPSDSPRLQERLRKTIEEFRPV